MSTRSRVPLRVLLAVGLFMAVLLGDIPVARATQVSGVTGPTLSTTAATATGVEYRSLGFTVSPSGALNSTGTVTVTGPPGTVFTGGCDTVVHNDTTGVDVGCGGAISNSGATITLDISGTVNPGDHLTVRFRRVTNPAAGTYTLTVSTSSDQDPVTSAPYTVTPVSAVSSVAAPSLSTTAATATAVEYSDVGFTVSPTGALNSDGSITVTGPPGTVFTGGCDTVVHNDTTGVDVGCGGGISNGGATLTLDISGTVNPGDHLTIRFRRVTNPAPGTYTLTVSTSSDRTPVTSAPYTVTAASTISAVTAPTLSSTAAGATGVQYSNVGFTVSSTGALNSDGSITVTGPPGTVFTGGCDTVVHNDTTGVDVGCGGGISNGGATITLDISGTVNPGDHLTIRFRRVTNPAPGTYTLTVSTSSDRTPVTSAPYTVTAASTISAVTAPTLSSTAATATGVQYSNIGFTVSSTGALNSDGSITISAPAGTVFTGGCDTVVHNDTTGVDVGCGGGISNGGATITLDISGTVNPGDHLTIRLRRVTNPAPGTYTLTASTSSDRTPVTSAPYTVTAVSTISAVTAPTLSTTAATATAVEYSDIGFTVSSTGALNSDGSITISAPAGTVFTGGCDTVVHDDTTGVDVGCGGGVSNGGGTINLDISGTG